MLGTADATSQGHLARGFPVGRERCERAPRAPRNTRGPRIHRNVLHPPQQSADPPGLQRRQRRSAKAEDCGHFSVSRAAMSMNDIAAGIGFGAMCLCAGAGVRASRNIARLTCHRARCRRQRNWAVTLGPGRGTSAAHTTPFSVPTAAACSAPLPLQPLTARGCARPQCYAVLGESARQEMVRALKEVRLKEHTKTPRGRLLAPSLPPRRTGGAAFGMSSAVNTSGTAPDVALWIYGVCRRRHGRGGW